MRVLEDSYPLSKYNSTMTKKKRNKKKPQYYDSTDEGEQLPFCRHIAKSVNLTTFKKTLKPSNKEPSCTGCTKDGHVHEEGEENTVWFCLQCGYQGCGRYSTNKHALNHSQADFSVPHKLAMNLTDGDSTVWCYDCDDVVPKNGNGKLEEAVRFVQKHFKGGSCAQSIETATITTKTVSWEKTTPSTNHITPKLKGLSNLGNTCFFNAVIQSICQVKEFHQMLRSYEDNGVTWSLPGFPESSSPAPDESDEEMENKGAYLSSLDPLEIQLSDNGMLTKALLKLFEDMSSDTEKSTLSPQNVFRQISSKNPRFKGFQQQDSHELLMNLLDLLKKEEENRIKSGILAKFKATKNQADEISDATKAMIKSYGYQAKWTSVDSLFGGHLVSTVQCEDCKHASQIFEPFLDLSLPVCEEKTRRGSRKCSTAGDDLQINNSDDTKISKHQLKKNREAARKSKKAGYNKRDSQKEEPIAEPVITPEPATKDLECAGACELVGEETVTQTKPEGDNSDSLSQTSRSCTPKSGYNSDNEGRSLATDSDGMNSSEMNVVLNGMTELTLNGDLQEEISPKVLLHRAVDMSMQPLGERQELSPHECSILSCLGQFTHPEMLTAGNKFACTSCTKQAKRNSASSDKQGRRNSVGTVYSNARKQLMIFQPPAILTLHLKRFQQVGFSLRKVNRHVQFDMTLNLSPFCSRLAKGIEADRTEVNYRLFAIVEHSGQLHSGHYTAYVRYRPASHVHKEFLQTSLFKHKPKTVLLDQMKRLSDNQLQDDAREEAASNSTTDDNSNSHHHQYGTSNSTSGKWFHISDSHVTEVTERTVLACQAYILFYERIQC